MEEPEIISEVKTEIYYNPIQLLFVLAPQLTKYLIGGRGMGKSTINGHESRTNIMEMPRSRGLILGLTYNQILTKTLPPILQMWEKLGMVRDYNYYIGRRPPDKLKWPRAYMQPERYDNVISAWNGTAIDLVSFDRKDHARGGSYDWAIIDEAALINIDRYNTEIKTSIRPSSIFIANHKKQGSEIFTSSMPWLDSGYWLIEKGDEYKKLIKQGKNPDFFYIEGTSWHNRKVLTDRTINMWKRTMPPEIYAVEVMNARRKKGRNSFYPALSEKVHYYSDSFNYDYWDSLDFQIDSKKSFNSKGDSDCNPTTPLNLCFDFGAFNSFTVDQEAWPYVKFLKIFFTTGDKILNDILDEFLKYYDGHKNKTVHLWGDKSGNKKQENSKTTLYEDVEARLRKAGWRVIRRKMGDVEHIARYRFFSILLREEDHRLPRVRINQNNCKELIISCENAKMIDNKKDKRGERNPSLLQQFTTHLSDCFDYRLYHGYADRLEGAAANIKPYQIRIGA
jgi:hypothetical protein